MSEEKINYNTNGKIYTLIPKVMSEIEAVGKDLKNIAQNYKFRGIDQIANELKPRLASNGIFFTPEVLTHEITKRPTKGGGELICTFLTVKFTFYASDGSNVTCITVGEGADSGDKSANKAMSAAWKYAMIQVFCIPTSDPKDSEFDSPDQPNVKFKEPVKKKDTTHIPQNSPDETELENMSIDNDALFSEKFEKVKKSYFATLAECGIVTDEDRHKWQKETIGTESSKDWTIPDYERAIDILKSITQIDKDVLTDSFRESIDKCTSYAELSEWVTNNIDLINELPKNDKISLMDYYRSVVKTYR